MLLEYAVWVGLGHDVSCDFLVGKTFELLALAFESWAAELFLVRGAVPAVSGTQMAAGDDMVA